MTAVRKDVLLPQLAGVGKESGNPDWPLLIVDDRQEPVTIVTRADIRRTLEVRGASTLCQPAPPCLFLRWLKSQRVPMTCSSSGGFATPKGALGSQEIVSELHGSSQVLGQP
mgnify:CR=1 FL=1